MMRLYIHTTTPRPFTWIPGSKPGTHYLKVTHWAISPVPRKILNIPQKAYVLRHVLQYLKVLLRLCVYLYMVPQVKLKNSLAQVCSEAQSSVKHPYESKPFLYDHYTDNNFLSLFMNMEAISPLIQAKEMAEPTAQMAVTTIPVLSVCISALRLWGEDKGSTRECTCAPSRQESDCIIHLVELTAWLIYFTQKTKD